MNELLVLTPLASLGAFGHVLEEFWGVLSQMAPYLLFGFLVAGLLSVWISPELVERHLGGRGMGPVVKAALFGVPLPLCSCGVIPVAASLRRHGASPGATTAFLLSTPQTGVDSILVTLSLLGPVFALFRPLAALATGIVGGALILLFGSASQEAGSAPRCEEACCTEGPRQNWLRRALDYGFVTLPRDIGNPLLIGLIVAGVIAALVPGDFFAGYLGRGIVPMLVMAAVGIPVYVCATASVPIAAALILKGLSPGAALVFLITGPATNAATLATLWKLLGRRAALLYLATVAVGALACGLLLDQLISSADVVESAHCHEFLPLSVRIASATVLLGVLAFALVRPAASVAAEPSGGASSTSPGPHAATVTLRVRGMTCSHCVATVRRALLESPGVASAEVSLEAGTAQVQGAGFDVGILRRAIEALGYTVEEPAG